MAIDPIYYSSSLILNGEGADGSTTFTDISVSPKTPTVNGDAKISTAQFKTGSASMLFDGTGDFLEYASDPGFDFGTGDFTIELWWLPTSASTDSAFVTYAKNTVANENDVAFGLYHMGATLSGKVQGFFNSGTSYYITNGTSVLSAGVWHHIVWERIDGVLYLYINGLLQAYTSAPATINEPASRTLRVGKWRTGSTLYANGNMDGLRITKGIGRYTENFTPSTDLFEATPTGVGDGAVTLPALSVIGYGGGNLDLTLPALRVLGFGAGNSALTLQALQMHATGHDATGENSLNLALPALTLSAYGGGTAKLTLPVMTIAASATGVSIGRASLVLPALTIQAQGAGGGAGNAAMRLPALTAMGYGGGNGAMRLPALSMSASVRSGAVGHGAVTLPPLELLAAASAQAHGSANLILPALLPGPSGQGTLILPVLRISATGHAVVAITYEAYAVNLKPGNRAGVHEVTHYTNWPFHGIVRYRGSYYGWGPGGLYLLGGTTDYNAATPQASDAIDWSWKTAITDFKSPMGKNVPAGFIRGRIGPDVTASVSIGERADTEYSATIIRGQNAQNHRIKFGRGMDDTYYSFGLAGTGQGDVAELALDVIEHKRRI